MMMKLSGLALAAGLAASLMGTTAFAEAVTATPGQAVNAVLLPKFLGILPFDQANRGAQEAAAELKSTGKLEFIGGIEMSSSNALLGAVSGIRFRPDGRSFVAVMDTGHWLEGRIERL